MKSIDDRYVKQLNNILNQYNMNYPKFIDYFNHLDELKLNSLQEDFYNTNYEYLEEVNFILSVISSIIAHPHISINTEELILRTELANEVSPNDFKETLKDSKLWTELEDDMIPDYVYHTHSIDELKIYENIFIVNLIKYLDFEIKKYNDFYISRIPSYKNQESLTIKLENSLKGFDILSKINRKMRRIKHTYFYKAIYPFAAGFKNTHATNILLNDRLYNYCYKFYRKIISSLEDNDIDLRSYYCCLLLKCFKNKNYHISNDNLLSNDVFNIKFNLLENNKLELNITNLIINKTVNYHLLFNKDLDISSNYLDNTLIFDIFNIYNYVNNQWIKTNDILTEKEMVLKFINNITNIIEVYEPIYSKYCPICKSSYLDFQDEHYCCDDCHAEYFIYSIQNINYLWFTKIGGTYENKRK